MNNENEGFSPEEEHPEAERQTDGGSAGVPPHIPIDPPPKTAGDPLGAASVALGVASITVGLCINFVGLVLAAAAILLSLMSRSAGGGRASVNARVGLALGTVGAVIGLIGAVAAILLSSPETKAAFLEWYKGLGIAVGH